MVSMTKLTFSQIFHRITQNRLSFSFFLFSFVACFAQGILHSFLFSVDSEYKDLLYGITNASALPPRNHTFLEGGGGYWSLTSKGHGELNLIMCNDVPKIGCFNIFNSSQDIAQQLTSDQNSTMRGEFLDQRHQTPFSFFASTSASDGSHDPAVTLGPTATIAINNITLTRQCTQILNYPQQHMHTALREDLTLVFFQFWLLAMSVYAMINDSVPHILAPLFARILLLGWSSYAIMRTHHQKLVFFEMVERDGTPCSIALFSAYFGIRMGYEIADIILNTSACITASYLSWTLLKIYNTRSFKRVGAPEAITKLYKYLLALLAVLHLALFVILTAISLWIDQLLNSYIKYVSLHTTAYLACFIITIVLVTPWIASGYKATTRERRNVMTAFLGIGVLFLFGWSLMFWSQVFRWTFIMWPYFGCHTVASFLLIIISIVLGLICRFNFGKGLKQYLRAESALAASNFKPAVFEHDAEKAMAEEEDDYLSSPTSSIYKLKLDLTTTGLPVLLSPAPIVSPTSKTTKEEQEWRGERDSRLPIPTYYPRFSVPTSLPKGNI